MLLVAAIAVASLTAGGLSGCSLTQDKGALSSTLVDEKALYAMDTAMLAADTAAAAAADSGVLIAGSPLAVKIADWLEQGHTALLAARTAYRLGDAATAAAKLSAAQAFIAQAWALIPQKEA